MNKLTSTISLSFILFLLIASTGCAHYSRGPWEGKVIDAETKQPIEGAAVMAEWKEDYAAFPGGGRAFVDATETLTDNNGNFKITSKSFFATHLDGAVFGPDFKIFKPSYRVYEFGDDGNSDKEHRHFYPKDRKNQFEKPGAVVELTKLKTREERLKNTIDATPDIEPQIYWRKIKNYVHLLNIEEKELGIVPSYEPK